MIITMQGNWTVAVKSKNASFPQRFVVQGAATANGSHPGTPGTSVYVTGSQWSISIQNNPGTGWQTSDAKLLFPHQVGGHYEFNIQSDDAGGDGDFNDLILTCSTPVNINDFIVYGNITLYNPSCIFNPCRRFPYVIETNAALIQALKNPLLSDYIKKYYPERVPGLVNPNPPDPAPYFSPIVFDLTNEATQPKTSLQYVRNAPEEKKKKTADAKEPSFAVSDFKLVSSTAITSAARASSLTSDRVDLANVISGVYRRRCLTDPGANLTLTFEEYDRTGAELLGGAYTGTGNRRLLGDTITDMNGNYIFKFSFDMTFPDLEDAVDVAPGEDVNVVLYPDVIVKIVGYSPFQVLYESAPYYNIHNLKRIDLCLPETTIHVPSACFNGNLIGSLGNVFIGGNQNNTASLFPPNLLRRYGDSNYLESNGVVSVNSPLAGFNVECAAWGGTIEMKGCMYDAAKTAANNKIKWYTIRINRAGTAGWQYVSQNYKHPKFHNRNLPNYIGDDVGPFYPSVGGTLIGTIPAYTNIQREIFVDGIDWEFSNMDRYMQLNTALYDVLAGVITPGTFYVRVDGYDATGHLVANATDLVPLFIHNKIADITKVDDPGFNVRMTQATLNDPAIVHSDCNLFRLTDAQMKTPMSFSFEASDNYGFVDSYALTMGRCPGTALDVTANIEGNFTINGSHTFPGGNNSLNIHHVSDPIHACPGYTGTDADYSTSGVVSVVINPPAVGDGWIKTGEYFTIYSFSLTAYRRVTNGYNSGVSGPYQQYSQLMMERLTP